MCDLIKCCVVLLQIPTSQINSKFCRWKTYSKKKGGKFVKLMKTILIIDGPSNTTIVHAVQFTNSNVVKTMKFSTTQKEPKADRQPQS